MANEITWRLENEKISRLLLHYAIPAVIGTMVNALYNIVDRIFIGQGVGPLAMAGLTLTFPILLFLQAFGMLVGAGAATRVSIHLGRKANDMAEKVLGNAFTLTFLITIVTVVPCMIWMEDLLLAFGGSEQTIPYAKDYLNIVVPGTILTSLSFGFNAVMRASGYPKKAMFTMLIGAVANVILDPIFIFWLDMGIKGAAVATIISMLLCTLFVMNHFVQKDSIVRFHRGTFRLERHVVWNILTIGVSPFAMQLAGSLVVVIQNYALKQHGGDLALGANGIISSVGMLLVMLVIGIAQGMQPIVGYNFGAKKYDRVQETLRLVIIAATIIMGIGCFCSVVFPKLIARAFTNDPALLDVTANGLLVFIVVGSQISISQFFQSIGIAWKAMFLSLSRQVLFLIPAMLLFSRFWGLDGVWYAAPFSDFIAAVTAWLFLWYHVKNMKSKGLG
ncbi:MATE family efflux transporter [Parabacteroides sp. AF17-28]|uniref:MATE family efflux transporter n=1 Tax=Parabacteroides sp. AF17-28 TaxID=2292241 RepID=UPI000F0080D7|nr:MATE family efflux transporter [Parabacteroides sp. AF17-28]RHR60816.1 MATE family efflux transporter [Parabacteroides sp. AF17-28]